MDEFLGFYLGLCAAAWGVGFAAGLIHRAFTQVAEHVT